MAYEAKTTQEAESIASFLDRVEPPQRQAEARRLVQLFSEVTGFAPRLWTGGMVGFARLPKSTWSVPPVVPPRVRVLAVKVVSTVLRLTPKVAASATETAPAPV